MKAIKAALPDYPHELNEELDALDAADCIREDLDPFHEAPFFSQRVKEEIKLLNQNLPQGEHLYHLFIVKSYLDGREIINAAHSIKPLQRYNILPGKTFASGPKSPDQYKIVRLISDDVVVENHKTKRIEVHNINKLIEDWGSRKFKEITFLDDIVETVRKFLGPALGAFLTAALISWLMEKLS